MAPPWSSWRAIDAHHHRLTRKTFQANPCIPHVEECYMRCWPNSRPSGLPYDSASSTNLSLAGLLMCCHLCCHSSSLSSVMTFVDCCYISLLDPQLAKFISFSLDLLCALVFVFLTFVHENAFSVNIAYMVLAKIFFRGWLHYIRERCCLIFLLEFPLVAF